MYVSLRLLLTCCIVGCSGCWHAQTGPLVGFSPQSGVAVGWEAGAGAGMLNGTLGTEIRPFGDRQAELYAAAEPSLTLPLQDISSVDYPDRYVSLGITAGYAVDVDGSTSPLAGGWIGVPWIRSGDCRESWVPTASVSIGVHVFLDSAAADWTLYATPKLGTINCVDFRSSFPKI